MSYQQWEAVSPQPPSSERVAPAGTIWVCAACGKTSHHIFGRPDDPTASLGWDESCMLNAVLCRRPTLLSPEQTNSIYRNTKDQP